MSTGEREGGGGGGRGGGRDWEREVVKIVRKFGVSEKSLWHIKVQCFCRSGSWTQLSKLAAEKKSPIGYKPFAVACIKHKRPASEVEKYIEKISAGEDKFDLYMELELWRKAIDVAIKLRDPNRLMEAGRACKDPALARLVQDSLDRL